MPVDVGTQTAIDTILSTPLQVLLGGTLFLAAMGFVVLAVVALRQVSLNSKQTSAMTDLLAEIKQLKTSVTTSEVVALRTDSTVTEMRADVRELTRLQRLALNGLKTVWVKLNALEKAQQKQADLSGLHATLEDIKTTVRKVALSIQQSKDESEET